MVNDPFTGRMTPSTPIFDYGWVIGNAQACYTALLINSPTIITAVFDCQRFSKSIAYNYTNTLAELGVTAELDKYERLVTVAN